MHWLRNLALGLDAGVPLACDTGHCDVFDCTFDSAALAVANPAQLGKPDTAIASVKFATLREAEAAADALFF